MGSHFLLGTLNVLYSHDRHLEMSQCRLNQIPEPFQLTSFNSKEQRLNQISICMVELITLF